MTTDIFPFAGWVLVQGAWVRCEHPIHARQATGGSLDGPMVVCLACGVYDSVVFHNNAPWTRGQKPPSTKGAKGE